MYKFLYWKLIESKNIIIRYYVANCSGLKCVQKMLHAANHVLLTSATYCERLVYPFVLQLCENVPNISKIKPNVKNWGYLQLCGKVATNSQKGFLKPRNVCKWMVVEVMAYLNYEK